MIVAVANPQRPSSPASAIAWRAATTANWEKRSINENTFGSKWTDGSKSATSAPIFEVKRHLNDVEGFEAQFIERRAEGHGCRRRRPDMLGDQANDFTFHRRHQR